jgi:hypothetical protein
MILVLLPTDPGFATEPSNSWPFPSSPETTLLPPPEPVIEEDPRSTDTDNPPSPPGINENRTAPASRDYPRLSLGTYWVQDWLDKPEGLAFLYQFQEIYGPSAAEDVLMIKRMARADNHANWAAHTVWIQGDCLVTTDDWQSEPADWVFGLARNNVMSAINMAVYMNRQCQVDWFLRDIHGEKMRIWSNAHFALNLTPDCPLGAWDGMITYQGRRYSLGDTRGLTLVQWMKGPLTQAVIRNSLFSKAFDGLQAEDCPEAWLYYFNGQIPDPKRDGVGFPSPEQFETYCRDVWRSWFLDFLKPLQDKFIVRLNGHHLGWYFAGVENPWPEIQQAANGCKLERYFGGGGWPNWDRPMCRKVYHAIEQLYHPLLPNPYLPGLDERQGWDVSTIQLNASQAWPSERIDQYKRAGLASTLMGDGLFDGTAYEEDYYYTAYLRRGQTQYAPRDVPEMHVQLGEPLGPGRLYTIDPLHPLEYRQFFDADTKRLFTVVSNVWPLPVAGIPAEDGVWFLGRWPRGKFQRLTDGVGDSYLELSPAANGPAVVAGGASDGRGMLRAVPSVTRMWSNLGFSAPVASAVEVCVIGVNGEMVRTLLVASGQQSVVWDGRDMAGRRVAPGLYFAHAGGKTDGQTARVLIVR